MKKYLGLLISLVLLGTVVQEGKSQCKVFTKKRCMKELDEFTNNGQYNGAVMFEGEEATLMQTFYSDKNYRMLVCAHPSIEDAMYFELLDYRNNLIYSSEGTGNAEFDFNVESTQQLKVRIVVTDGQPDSQIKKNGCISVVVGFQEK
ncbi:MAG: hypothetical protein Salg2KO_02770 [Salibacteraceae bacterium]